MRPGYRLIAAVLLLAATLVFTGALESAASALLASKADAAQSCCDDCDQHGNGATVPCAASACPLFLCLAVETTEPARIEVVRPVTYVFPSYSPKPVPDPFLPSIFRPPAA